MQNSRIPSIQYLEDATRSDASPRQLGQKESSSRGGKRKMVEVKVVSKNRNKKAVTEQGSSERSEKPIDEDGGKAIEKSRGTLIIT